jgi:hypothetical protein
MEIKLKEAQKGVLQSNAIEIDSIKKSLQEKQEEQARIIIGIIGERYAKANVDFDTNTIYYEPIVVKESVISDAEIIKP